MTRFLQQLRLHDRQTAELLMILENLTGNRGLDISFSSEIEHRQREVLASLGLDPKDTSAIELYRALEQKMLDDGQNFIKKLGCSGKSESKAAEALVSNLKTWFADKTVLVPKTSALKKLLKQNPPKAALKLLHYRSLDSMLRRCSLSIIFAACDLTESKKWRQNLVNKIDALESNDFELQKVDFCTVPAERWEAFHRALLQRSGHSVFRVNLAGGIVIVPAARPAEPSQVLLLLMATLSALSKLRAHSSFTPRVMFDSSVPTKFSEHVYDRDGGFVVVRGVQFGWREIHQHMADDKRLRELFEPHLNKQTVKNDDMKSLLNAVGEPLGWWSNVLSLGFSDGQTVVSCNLYDVSRNAAYERPLGRHTTMAFNRELDTELRLRFLKDERLAERIYDQLNAATDFDSDPLMLELEEIL